MDRVGLPLFDRVSHAAETEHAIGQGTRRSGGAASDRLAGGGRWHWRLRVNRERLHAKTGRNDKQRDLHVFLSVPAPSSTARYVHLSRGSGAHLSLAVVGEDLLSRVAKSDARMSCGL